MAKPQVPVKEMGHRKRQKLPEIKVGMPMPKCKSAKKNAMKICEGCGRPWDGENVDFKRKLVAEAKHSFISVMGIVGSDTNYNHILLKWPDVADALLEDKDGLFLKDISRLICLPFKILAESLQEMLSDDKNLDIGTSMVLSEEDPIEAKKNLIRLCNSMIYRLKATGKKVEYVIGLGEKGP